MKGQIVLIRLECNVNVRSGEAEDKVTRNLLLSQ